MTPLHEAAQRDDLPAAATLLERGAPLEARDEQAWTPLHWAAASGAANVTQLLIERGARIEPRARFDMRPIHWAALRGHATIVAQLVEQGASMEARNLYGMTPLHLAGNGEVAALLLNLGAAPDAVDDNDMTPLHWSRSSAVAEALVDANANMVARARDDRRPIDMAAASSERVFELVVYPHSKQVRLKHDTTSFGVTLLNFGLEAKKRVRVFSRSDAVRLVGVVPEIIESLEPGQIATAVLELDRVRGYAAGLHPITIETRHRDDQPMVELALQVDTSRGNTPEDRGLVQIGRATIEPEPSRWQMIVYLIVPVLILGIWLHRRRRR